jgi:hypothetical protein
MTTEVANKQLSDMTDAELYELSVSISKIQIERAKILSGKINLLVFGNGE